MRIRALLGFAPFLAFALIEKLIGIQTDLVARLAVSLALTAWDGARNIFEGGSAVVFGTLSLIDMRGLKSWSV